MSKIALIIPCYNEGERLQFKNLETLLQNKSLNLVLVNDGSTDHTLSLLEQFQKKHPHSVEVISFDDNAGKAEAIRRAAIDCIQKPYDIIGYADADFATPASEILRLLNFCQSHSVVMGSRIRMLGTDITRHAMRHYLGRIFATFASLILNLPVYDTQCGAKFFKNSPALNFAFSAQFISPWAFDVELIGKLIIGTRGIKSLMDSDFIEVPLQKWQDVAGSKVSLWQSFQMGLDLWRIHLLFKRLKRSN